MDKTCGCLYYANHMQHLIDPISLAFIAGIMVFALFLCFFSLYKTSTTYPGFKEWTTATILLSFGGLLVGVRNLIPGVFSIIIGNAVVVMSMLLMKRGIEKFYEEEGTPVLDAAILTCFVFCHSYFTHFDNLHGRTINVSAAYTVIHALMLLPLIRQRAKKRIYVSNLLTGSLIFFITFNMLRACSNAYFMFYPAEKSAEFIFGLSMIFQIPSALLVYMSLIVTNAQRVAADLIEANSQIKTLQGIIPICCQCKKIRSESDAWQAIESYIKEHSNAEFTHGICPECTKALYPDLKD